jgi:hypothetical protein
MVVINHLAVFYPSLKEGGREIFPEAQTFLPSLSFD